MYLQWFVMPMVSTYKDICGRQKYRPYSQFVLSLIIDHHFYTALFFTFKQRHLLHIRHPYVSASHHKYIQFDPGGSGVVIGFGGADRVSGTRVPRGYGRLATRTGDHPVLARSVRPGG